MNLSGFDVRFSYDNSKIKPSNLITNDLTNEASQYFKFEQEFGESLEFFTIPEDEENVIRGIVSFNPQVEESEHIIEKEEIGKVVDTQGGVLIRKNEFSNDRRRI